VTGLWACPDARLVLRADAPREEWLAARTTGLGGSDASVVAGVNRWTSAYELWLDKTGRRPGDAAQAMSEAMEWGIRLEAVIADWFVDTTGIPVRRAGLMRHRARPWQLASVDRLTGDGGGLEVKTLSWRVASEWDDDQVADHAEVQAQHYMAVTGRPHWWVVGLVDGRSPQLRRVDRNPDLIATLTGMEETFWTSHVLADVPPPVTALALDAVKERWSTVELEQVDLDPDQVLPAIARMTAAKTARKAAETEEKTAAAVIREALGPAAVGLVDGRVVATCKQVTTTRFNAAALRADHPDLAAGYTATASYRRLHIPKETSTDGP